MKELHRTLRALVFVIALVIPLSAFAQNPPPKVNSQAASTKDATSYPSWIVALEAGVQGSTFNSNQITASTDDKGLFKDTAPFFAVQNWITGANTKQSFGWAVKFDSVTVAVDSTDPDVVATGKNVLKNAQALELNASYNYKFWRTIYAGGSVSGFTPVRDNTTTVTTDQGEVNLRASEFLYEYYGFVGIVQGDDSKPLYGSYIQAGFGQTSRLPASVEYFAETRLTGKLDSASKLAWFIQFHLTVSNGPDDLRATFGLSRTFGS